MIPKVSATDWERGSLLSDKQVTEVGTVNKWGSQYDPSASLWSLEKMMYSSLLHLLSHLTSTLTQSQYIWSAGKHEKPVSLCFSLTHCQHSLSFPPSPFTSHRGSRVPLLSPVIYTEREEFSCCLHSSPSHQCKVAMKNYQFRMAVFTPNVSLGACTEVTLTAC